MTTFEAKRLPVHCGPAAWSAILPDQPPPVRLEENLVVDVAIVGGGFAGLSAARRLHQIDPPSASPSLRRDGWRKAPAVAIPVS